MLKRIIFLMIVLLVVFGCAKKSTEWNENHVLSLDAQIPTIGNPLDLDASGNHVYIADDQGALAVVDLSDNSGENFFNLPTADGSPIDLTQVKRVSAVPAMNLLFINDIGTFGGSDLIRVFDIANPDSIKQIDYFTGATSSMQDMKFNQILPTGGAFTYEGVFIGGGEVKYGKYGIHDPEYPLHFAATQTITPTITPKGACMTNDYYFVATQQRGLMVYARSNEVNAAFVSECDLPGEAQKVVLAGNYAYVACRQAGLQIVDITNPAAPVKVGSYDTTGYASNLDVSGNYVAVSSGAGGVYLFDVTSPQNPVLKDNITSCGYVNDVKFHQGKLLVAGRDLGLLVYKIK